MLRRLSASIDRGILVLIILFLIALPLLFKPWVHGNDPVGYYSWLRSIVIDGDLDTTNEWEHYGLEVGGTTQTGYRDNPFAIGSAILWSPFFLTAHVLTLIGQRLQLNLIADGYSPQYVLAISLGTAIYGFAGILITYRLARKAFAPAVATLATASIWFASPLVFYQYSNPAMSHANDAFTYALFLYTWHTTRRHRSLAQHGLVGLTAGLSALVRTQNAILVFFPLFEIAASAVQEGRRGNWKHAMLSGLSRGAALSVTWWLVFLPQMFVWHITFGTWLPGNPYAHINGGQFDFLHPHLLGVLWSTDRGLFVWTPLLLVAVLGWLPLWRKDRRLTTLLVFSFGLQLYITASWAYWNGAVSFGQRFFSNMTPAFVLGLAALLTVLNRRFSMGWLTAACILFVAWNGLLIVRYALEDIPRAGPVPLGKLIGGQFTIVPTQFSRIIQAILTHQP